MENPYSPPTATEEEAGSGFLQIGDRFLQSTGMFSSKSYVGRVVCSKDEIAYIGEKDLAAQTGFAAAGLIGYLLVKLFQRKPVPVDLDTLPATVRTYIEDHQVKPIVVHVVRREQVTRIRFPMLGGVQIRVGKATFSCGIKAPRGVDAKAFVRQHFTPGADSGA